MAQHNGDSASAMPAAAWPTDEARNMPLVWANDDVRPGAEAGGSGGKWRHNLAGHHRWRWERRNDDGVAEEDSGGGENCVLESSVSSRGL